MGQETYGGVDQCRSSTLHGRSGQGGWCPSAARFCAEHPADVAAIHQMYQQRYHLCDDILGSMAHAWLLNSLPASVSSFISTCKFLVKGQLIPNGAPCYCLLLIIITAGLFAGSGSMPQQLLHSQYHADQLEAFAGGMEGPLGTLRLGQDQDLLQTLDVEGR